MLPWGSLSGDCDLEADLELEKAGMAVAEKSEAFRLDPPEFVVGLQATPPLGVSPRPVGPRPGSAALAALRAPLGHTRPGEVLPGDRCARWEELPPVPAPASLQVRLGWFLSSWNCSGGVVRLLPATRLRANRSSHCWVAGTARPPPPRAPPLARFPPPPLGWCAETWASGGERDSQLRGRKPGMSEGTARGQGEAGCWNGVRVVHLVNR